jgi:23S rRNA pseudouridine1911/1915/1917 synthase
VETRLSRAIPSHLVGERADKVVAELAGVSRQASRRLFAAGVTIDGEAVAPDRRVAGGIIEFPRPQAEPPSPEGEVTFGVLYEDADLLVVDKPPGLVVHPGAGSPRPTLASGLLQRFPDLEGVGEPGRWGIVHRLDRGTSGVLVVARSQPAYRRLQADLRARRIHRAYLALVHGVPSLPTGTIDAPIGRDPAHPTRQRVVAGGRPSRTHYRVVRRFAVAALLEIELETGRTHQIRAHMAAIDHPVVGDRAYSRRRDPVPVERIFLHAHRLSFPHPRTGEEISVESPMPADLAAVLVELARVYPDPAELP